MTFDIEQSSIIMEKHTGLSDNEKPILDPLTLCIFPPNSAEFRIEVRLTEENRILKRKIDHLHIQQRENQD